MAGCICQLILVGIVLVAVVNSQSYPRFEFREHVLTNNSFIVHGPPVNIGEGQNDSLHCVTDNSDCCNATNSAQNNWFDPMEREVQQGPDGDSDLYVTRGDGVVYLNRRRGGQSGMWKCEIPDSNGVQQSIYIYLGTSATGSLCTFVIFNLLQTTTGRLSSAVIYFTLNSEAIEDPPEFTLTCQSRGGPVTEVEWTRRGVRVEEDTNHMTSQIIVDTSANTVYNNTLRVRGREGGRYKCTVRSERHAQETSRPSFTIEINVKGMVIQFFVVIRTYYCECDNIVAMESLNLNATYKSPTSISLEWTFPYTPIRPYSYAAYYQSGGEGYSVAFTIDSLERDNRHELTGLPVGGVHSISLVALVDLPSPVAGPVTPGEFMTL